MIVEVTAPSRLHLSLCDLGNASPYMCGGIGLGISDPNHRITCQIGTGQVHCHGEAAKWQEELQRLFRELSVHCDTKSIDVEICSGVPPHSGFGSHTALSLGLIEAVGLVTRSGWTKRDIISLSKRGGTSGVGIQTYFQGGLAYDYGRPAVQTEYRPSSAELSMVELIQGPNIPFPAHWEVLLALPKGKQVYAETEVDFFRNSTPTKEIDALRAIANIHHGVIPAVKSADLEVLRRSLESLHQWGFKRLELLNQSDDVRNLHRRLISSGLTCGLSSFGPLVYAIVDTSDHNSRTAFSEAAKESNAIHFGATTVSSGRTILSR